MFGYRSLGFGAFPNRDVAFNISNSAVFNDGDADHLTRTYAINGNSTTYTLNFWVKRGVLSSRQVIYSAKNSTGIDAIEFFGDTINWVVQNSGGSVVGQLRTNALFRDPHAWMNINCSYDTNNSTAGDRMRMHVNGTEITSFQTDTNPSINANTGRTNQSGTNAQFGISGNLSSDPFDGYIAQPVFVDGKQLLPTSFGEFDTANRFKPKDLTELTTVSTTAEAIVNSASSVSTSDGTSYTFSSVALGTASSTRAAYVWISGQESTGTAGTITATINTGGGAVAMTKIRDINNATEAHYQGSLFRADISSGTSADIVASITRTMSQLGAIVWTVTGDHHLFDLEVDVSNSTGSVTLSNVPANSVILAGRAGNGSATQTHTWSSNVTENIDQVVETDGSTDVTHSGASTAVTIGNRDFTITCTPSNSSSRARTFALVLSPNLGVGPNGFVLPFTETNLGHDSTGSSTAATLNFVSFTASGASGSTLEDTTTFSYSSVSVGSNENSNRIILVASVTSGGGSGTDGISSLTCGGVSGTKVFENLGSDHQQIAVFRFDGISSGTTKDIEVTYQRSTKRCGLYVYDGTGLSLNPNTFVSTLSSSSTAITSDFDIQAGSAALAITVHANGEDRNTLTHANLTEDNDVGMGPDAGSPTGSGTQTGSGSATFANAVAAQTLTVTPSGTVPLRSTAFLVFGPENANNFLPK